MNPPLGCLKPFKFKFKIKTIHLKIIQKKTEYKKQRIINTLLK
jgi:hypothetical protein